MKGNTGVMILGSSYHVLGQIFDLRTQKRGSTVGAQASKERSLPSCWLYVLRKQDGAISPCANGSSELESGPPAEVTLQEQQVR